MKTRRSHRFIGITILAVCFIVFSMAGFCQQENVTAKGRFPKPAIVPHSEWQAKPPGGFPADGKRANIAPSEKIEFKDLTLELIKVTPADAETTGALDEVVIRVSKSSKTEGKTVNEGSAFNWEGFHIAVLAVRTRKGELGSGLTEFEICTVDSIPREIAESKIAGDATYRARIPHTITMITLHHMGSPRIMTPQDDPVAKLRGLQEWGKNDRNWWDVCYHFLIWLDGTIYEGRDYHYIGDTNTKYNPKGHFLISVMGNYNRQEPTEAQINAITDLMAWAVQEFNVPLDKIYGHCDVAATGCPGKYLRPYLKDGSFIKGIKERLNIK